MAKWHENLPSDIIDVLQLPAEELNDFAGPVTRMDIISRLTFQRAVEAVAREKEEPPEWGVSEGEEQKPMERSDATEALKLTVAAHKELVRAKFVRLEAKDRFREAQDKPEPMNIDFAVRLPTQKESVERFINMGRYEEARKIAILHRIEHEFDWKALEL